MKKLIALFLLAGIMTAGVIGCSETKTTKKPAENPPENTDAGK